MKLAIQGHYKRDKEVIQLLETLGGVNYYNLEGSMDGYCYYINDSNIINSCLSIYAENFIVYNLEEFGKKFPYKIGDKVIYEDKRREITKILWEEQTNTIAYKLDDKLYCNVIDDLQPYKESKCLQELKEYLDNATPEQLEEDWKELEKFSEVGPVADEYVEQCKENVNTNNLCTRCVYAVDNHCGLRGFTNDFNRPYCSAQNADKLPNGFELQPDGYFSWVDSKPQYPKDYVECCKIMKIHSSYELELCGRATTQGEITNCIYAQNLLNKINKFQKLLICRDAYWKIAGKQLGLDKPWEPEWCSESDLNYTIIYNGMYTIKLNDTNRHAILAFPTKEMRDTFYENFRELIEDCKELL